MAYNYGIENPNYATLVRTYNDLLAQLKTLIGLIHSQKEENNG